jgi:hypothetical protein
MELSIVLPCLNEAETLATCIDKAIGSLDALGVAGEVIVADNGSTDGSIAIAASHGARVVPVPDRGYGAALRGGIAAAQGTYVLMADADDSYALDDIGGFLDSLRGGADLVIGNRFKGGIAPGAMPALHRWLGNPLLSRIGRVFFRINVGDFHCGIRAFRRDRILALGLRTGGMEFASEMVVRAALANFRIEEVPTTLRPDGRSRPPHLRTWRDGWRHLRFLLAFSPRWLLFYPALALTLVGSVGVIALSFGAIHLGGVTFSVHTMLACAAAVAIGVQGVGLALVTRVYATQLGVLPESARLDAALARLTLNRGLAIGAATTALGVACFATAAIRWGASDFGDLNPVHTMRLPILGMVLLVAGLQLVMVSFTLSIETIAGVEHPARSPLAPQVGHEAEADRSAAEEKGARR